jgi:hypothetical protein
MTIPTYGPIAMSQINHEIGYIPDNANIWMDHEWLRKLAGRPGSGTYIAFSDFLGKSWYIPMSAYGTGDSRSGPTGSATFTSSCYPSVTVSGGSGGYSFSWSFQGSANGCSLSNAGNAQCTVSRQFGKAGGSVTVQMQCVITDNTGHQITVYNIEVDMNYGYQ